ncbi:MAG: penicillin-binding protein 1A [Halieaceae bacterium]
MGFTRKLSVLIIIGACGIVWGLAGLYLFLSPRLPEPEALQNITLQTPMRIQSRNGLLIAQFGEQKRNPLRFSQIPVDFTNALLAAEDDGFFDHSGIEILSLARAVSELVMTGRKGSGGSTLTMQVARNYFLTLDQTFLRKFTEILLAIEIERALSKEQILELYVNRVFLGHRAYGFEAAAQTYYGKSLWELSLAQQAMLAGIPKAPSRNNPLSNPEAGKIRRDWILGRMASLGMIDDATRDKARSEAVSASYYGLRVQVEADYVAEMVRQDLVERYGSGAYSDGYIVTTTVESRMQTAARDALLSGLMTYDQRHGWRGPERQLPPLEDESQSDLKQKWRAALADMPVIADLPPAIVIGLDVEGATLLTKQGDIGRLDWRGDLAKIRRYNTENSTRSAGASPKDLLDIGDLIRVRWDDKSRQWRLAQVPRAQAALVSLDPTDGAIRSLVGGMGFELSKFNRATQAKRQPGSNFKAFLYAAAVEHGVTPATLINDAPIVLDNLSNDEIWRPENDSGRFYGPTRVRDALTFSRNLVSIRVLQRLGISRFIDYAEQLGFDTSSMARNLTLALGTHAYTPLDIAAGYAIVANGGFKVSPYLIERIENTEGEVLYEADPAIACSECEKEPVTTDSEAVRMEDILESAADQDRNLAPRVMDARVSFIVSSMLQDVIQRGTGRRARVLERRDIAGKTGTTNGPRDAWFSGFNPELVTTTWVGFDDYSLLGRREFGGTAALPIWIDFMREALPETETPLSMPEGIVRLRIDKETGERVRGTPDGSMLEYFLEEFLPARKGDNRAPLDTDDLEGLF